MSAVLPINRIIIQIIYLKEKAYEYTSPVGLYAYVWLDLSDKIDQIEAFRHFYNSFKYKRSTVFPNLYYIYIYKKYIFISNKKNYLCFYYKNDCLLVYLLLLVYKIHIIYLYDNRHYLKEYVSLKGKLWKKSF